MLLALDIGRRRTGVAYADTAVGVPLALDTLVHASTEEWMMAIRSIVTEKKIDRIVVGLPLLPSGEEGEQAHFVREWAAVLAARTGAPLSFLDERYTTPGSGDADGDAAAAVELMHMALQRAIID
jgi:putative holliday junction resolvase